MKVSASAVRSDAVSWPVPSYGCVPHWSSPNARRVIAMLLAMYVCSCAYVLGSTVKRWMTSG